MKPIQNITLRIVISLLALSIVGLLAVFSVVNTVIRGIIYDDVISHTISEKMMRTQEVDSWFSDAAERVRAISTALDALPDERYFRDIAEHFVESNPDVIENLFIGFSDDRLINGVRWPAPDDWVTATRPWYIAAQEAGTGNIGFTDPYRSLASGNIAIAVSTFMTDLSGVSATVGTAIPIDFVLELINEHSEALDGYLILVNAQNNIIIHPDEVYSPTEDEAGNMDMLNLRDLPNSGYFLNAVLTGEVQEFTDAGLGDAYLIVTEFDVIDWTLLAIIPVDAVVTPVTENINRIMLMFALVLLVFFAVVTTTILHLVRNLDETKAMRERLELIFENVPIAAHLGDYNLNTTICNEELLRMFELHDKDEFLARFDDFSPERQPDGALSAEKSKQLIKAARDGERQQFMWTHQTNSGQSLPCELTLIPLEWSGEKLLLTFIRDMRDFYKYQETERLAKQRLQAILDSSPLACLLCDENMRVLEVNKEILKLFELDTMDEFSRDFYNLSPKYQPNGKLSAEMMVEMRDKVLEEGLVNYEWMCLSQSGKDILCQCTLVKIKIDGQPLIIGYMRDLREIVDAFSRAKSFENLAYTDVFTGAASRLMFTETAERALTACIRGAHGFSLITLDIDRFKAVNQQYGNSMGDEVLKVMVNRVQDTIDESVLLARYSGVKFVIMLPDKDTQQALALAAKIRRAINSAPFIISGIKLDITVCFGVASLTAEMEDIDTIIDNSGRALREAKAMGADSTAVWPLGEVG